MKLAKTLALFAIIQSFSSNANEQIVSWEVLRNGPPLNLQSYKSVIQDYYSKVIDATKYNYSFQSIGDPKGDWNRPDTNTGTRITNTSDGYLVCVSYAVRGKDGSKEIQVRDGVIIRDTGVVTLIPGGIWYGLGYEKSVCK
jgi:hypothetical protein